MQPGDLLVVYARRPGGECELLALLSAAGTYIDESEPIYVEGGPYRFRVPIECEVLFPAERGPALGADLQAELRQAAKDTWTGNPTASWGWFQRFHHAIPDPVAGHIVDVLRSAEGGLTSAEDIAQYARNLGAMLLPSTAEEPDIVSLIA